MKSCVYSAAGAVVMIALLAPLACSKKNNVDVSTDIVTGVACTGEGDPACGGDGACVLGYCRLPCTGDDECPQDSLCIGSDPFGCQLTWDAFCNLSQPCKEGLACGTDHKCRMPCTTSEECPRADQECEQGACFGSTELGDIADAGLD